jgi:hypothetical protein
MAQRGNKKPLSLRAGKGVGAAAGDRGYEDSVTTWGMAVI